MSRNFQGVGTGKFKTGCRRRKVIKEDFAGVPIRSDGFVSDFSTYLESWRAPVQGPGSLLGKFYVLTTYTMWLPSSRLCSHMEALAWHMHGLPMVRYQFGLLGRGSPKRVRHWLTSSFNDWLGWFSSGYSGFHPPITRDEKNNHAWFFNTKERIWIQKRI